MTIDPAFWFDLLTAALWLALALVGVVLRVRRSVRLYRIELAPPIDADDAAYLASEKRAAYLRIGVKVVFLIGALIAVFDLAWLWPAWRIGVVLALFFLVRETVGVDDTRRQLGRAVEVWP